MNVEPGRSAPLTIAVLKPCCIGDCVMALPAIASLATAFPIAHVHAFTGRHSAPVFRASQHITQVYFAPDQLPPSRVPGMVWNLRTAGHDWIVLLDRSRWLHTAARMASSDRLVTLGSTAGQIKHEIDIYLDAVVSAGGREVSRIPRLEPGEEAHARANEALGNVEGPFAVLHPGGAENPGAAMPNKRWPATHYASVAERLASRGIVPILTGGPGDVETCEAVVDLAGGTGITNLSGKLDLMATSAVIQRAAIYVGSDTGVSHLAAAVGTRSVVVFGPTNPDRYGPRGDDVVILAPAQSRALPDVDLRKPNAGRNRPSTSEITADEAIDAIDRLLAAAATG